VIRHCDNPHEAHHAMSPIVRSGIVEHSAASNHGLEINSRFFSLKSVRGVADLMSWARNPAETGPQSLSDTARLSARQSLLSRPGEATGSPLLHHLSKDLPSCSIAQRNLGIQFRQMIWRRHGRRIANTNRERDGSEREGASSLSLPLHGPK
jgi:hypothetical protein